MLHQLLSHAYLEAPHVPKPLHAIVAENVCGRDVPLGLRPHSRSELVCRKTECPSKKIAVGKARLYDLETLQ